MLFKVRVRVRLPALWSCLCLRTGCTPGKCLSMRRLLQREKYVEIKHRLKMCGNIVVPQQAT